MMPATAALAVVVAATRTGFPPYNAQSAPTPLAPPPYVLQDATLGWSRWQLEDGHVVTLRVKSQAPVLTVLGQGLGVHSVAEETPCAEGVTMVLSLSPGNGPTVRPIER